MNAKKDKIKYKLDEKDIVNSYLSNQSIKAIAKRYKVDFSVIRNRLVKNNIEIRKTTKKFPFNEKYFSTIDSEDKAYFLGFLFADGCNVEYESKVVINIQARDEYLLEVFKSKLDLRKPKQYRSDGYAKLLINSPLVSKDLSKLGCIKNKTLKLKFPTNVPIELIHHFVRGYFDGDGSVCISNNQIRFSINSTYEFLFKVQELLVDNLNLNRTKIHKDTKSKSYVLIYGGGINCHKIFEWLYKDASVFLKRKYRKFKTFEKHKELAKNILKLNKHKVSKIRQMYATNNYSIRNLETYFKISNSPIRNMLHYKSFPKQDLNLKNVIKEIIDRKSSKVV